MLSLIISFINDGRLVAMVAYTCSQKQYKNVRVEISTIIHSYAHTNTIFNLLQTN